MCASELGRMGRERSVRGRGRGAAFPMRAAIVLREGGLTGLCVCGESGATGGLQGDGLRFGLLGDCISLLMRT